MSEGLRVIMTGGRSRVARAVAAELGTEWRLRRFSRRAGDGCEPLEELLGSPSLPDADVLIHAAWSTVPATAEEDPESVARVDVPMAIRLAERLGGMTRPPLCVFLSTGAVYGPAPGRPSRESDVPAPMGVYARGKLAAENVFSLSRVPLCILRSGPLYALPAEESDRQGVIARLVRCALTGAVFRRWGGDSLKDYLHGSDFLQLLRRVATQRLTGVWNAGSGAAVRLSTLIAMVEAASGRSLSVESVPPPAWDVPDNRLDVSRLQDATGWSPRVTLEEGIRQMVGRMRATD